MNLHSLVTRIGAPVLISMAFGLSAPSALANNVTNGGFETGDLTDWTVSGDASFVGVTNGIANSGTYAAFFGPDPVGSIAQTFATLAGRTYQVQFELALDDSAMPNSFSWMWNGVAQSTLSNVSGFGYTLFTGLVTATSTTATLKFDFTDPQSFWLLDDVSVNVVAVPEPPTFALLALGILVAGLKRVSSKKREEA